MMGLPTGGSSNKTFHSVRFTAVPPLKQNKYVSNLDSSVYPIVKTNSGTVKESIIHYPRLSNQFLTSKQPLDPINSANKSYLLCKIDDKYPLILSENKPKILDHPKKISKQKFSYYTPRPPFEERPGRLRHLACYLPSRPFNFSEKTGLSSSTFHNTRNINSYLGRYLLPMTTNKTCNKSGWSSSSGGTKKDKKNTKEDIPSEMPGRATYQTEHVEIQDQIIMSDKGKQVKLDTAITNNIPSKNTLEKLSEPEEGNIALHKVPSASCLVVVEEDGQQETIDFSKDDNELEQAGIYLRDTRSPESQASIQSIMMMAEQRKNAFQDLLDEHAQIVNEISKAEKK